MRTGRYFTALQRTALVCTMSLLTGGSSLVPLTAQTVNTATIRLWSSTSTTVCGATVTFSALVTSSSSQTITWFVDGIAKGNATVGTLAPNGDQAHVIYKAPAVSGTHVIKAVATNAAGAKVSRSTTLTVNKAPVNTATITLWGSTSTTVCGATVSYSAAVTSSSSQTITWFVDGIAKGNATVGAITPNGDQAHVLYKAPAVSGTHEIMAVATNSAGAKVSKSTTLTVKGVTSATLPPSITTQPRSVAVTLGQSATFSVAATNTVPSTYQWRKNGTAINGATAASYSTPATVASDSGALFSVVVTNAAGSVLSTAAALTVNAPPPAILSFSASPSTVMTGQGCILSWTGSGATQLNISPAVGDVTGLTTKNLSPTATTTYTLTARNATGQTVTATTSVVVSAVPAAPSITSQPQSRTVTLGQTATFTVSAASASNMSYQWRKNGTAINGATSSSYTTPATVEADSGVRFTVVVSNTTGSVTSTEASLLVNSSQKQYYGFGSKATGGAGHPTVHVTNLSSSGAGSLREAISGGSNRTIVFDVGGTIAVPEALTITGANITIDGSTAPAPGITLSGHSLRLMNGANNIILTSFRHRGGWDGSGSGGGDPDNISIMVGCHNIMVDHLSLSNSYDENLGIWDGNYDITVQNCILGDGNPNGERYGMLISNRNLRVTVYHNIFHNAYYRQPAVGWDTDGVDVAPSIVADVVNNLVWDYPTRGTTVYWGGKANVVGNHYFSSLRPGESNRAVNTESKGVSHASGNYSKDGSSVSGTTATPFSVAAYAQIEATSAAAAATFVKANAGCRTGGLDAVDVSILGDIVP